MAFACRAASRRMPRCLPLHARDVFAIAFRFYEYFAFTFMSRFCFAGIICRALFSVSSSYEVSLFVMRGDMLVCVAPGRHLMPFRQRESVRLFLFLPSKTARCHFAAAFSFHSRFMRYFEQACSFM